MEENKNKVEPKGEQEVDNDELGENTELTELAVDSLKEKDKKVEAINNQETKGFEGEDG
jgi:hypothetical protein